jgi:hypothetical protein
LEEWNCPLIPLFSVIIIKNEVSAQASNNISGLKNFVYVCLSSLSA